MQNFILPTIFILGLVTGCSPTSSAPTEDSVSNAGSVPESLTIYSSRHYDSDRTLYEAYEQETGVTVDVREAGAPQLLETLRAEGANSPADIVIAADAGALWKFQDAGLTQPLQDTDIEGKIPANLRETDGNWFGLARRVRLVAYDPTRFDPSDVDSWAKLTSEDKRGEICVRSSSNIYNLSLLGEIIAREGEDAASEWAEGVVANMARNPQGGDSDQIRAVGAGVCGIAIVNHYYWLRMAKGDSEADRAATDATRLIVPTFSDGAGAHTNITGIAITKTASDTGQATDFINFLLTKDAQELLTVETKELPIIEGANLPDGAELLPDFVAAETPLETLGLNQSNAQRIYDLAGWN